MSCILSLGTFIVLSCLIYAVECEEDQCRQLDFRSALAFRGKQLLNHAIGVVDVIAKDFCGALCFMEPNCVSYNILVSSDSPPITKCELNDATHFEHPHDLVSAPNSTHRGSKNACIKRPCPKNYICQAGFSSQGYRCICTPGYTGEDCAKDVDECDLREHKCDSNADCVNAPGSYDCKCKEGFLGDGRTCTDVDECSLREHKCDSNADCVNAPGSYDCKCKEGFSGDGRNCTDIDECASGKNNCTIGDANCTNTVGSFNCTCQIPYFWNGSSCEVDGCFQYSFLNDANRKTSYVTPNHQVLCDKQLPKGWYRFSGVAGTKMATTRVPAYRCGTNWSGWLDGAHPTVKDVEVFRKVCFSDRTTGCKFSTRISVKNCGFFYIYKLLQFESCDVRYCGTD